MRSLTRDREHDQPNEPWRSRLWIQDLITERGVDINARPTPGAESGHTRDKGQNRAHHKREGQTGLIICIAEGRGGNNERETA